MKKFDFADIITIVLFVIAAYFFILFSIGSTPAYEIIIIATGSFSLGMAIMGLATRIWYKLKVVQKGGEEIKCLL